GAALSRPGVAAFWWPRFARIARWFIRLEAERRAALLDCRSELLGRLIVRGPAGPFELTGKADRIDRGRDGALVIIDYKTGTGARRAESELGLAPHRPLEAMIAAAGGFAGLAAAPVGELAYWRLSGGEVGGEVKPVAIGEGAVRALAENSLAGLA